MAILTQSRIRSAADLKSTSELVIKMETIFDKHEVTLAADSPVVETRAKCRSSRGNFFGAREDYTALAGLGQDVEEISFHKLCPILPATFCYLLHAVVLLSGILRLVFDAHLVQISNKSDKGHSILEVAGGFKEFLSRAYEYTLCQRVCIWCDCMGQGFMQVCMQMDDQCCGLCLFVKSVCSG